MVSRKKLKGKARKEAKAKKEEEHDCGAAFFPKQLRTKKECTHGWDPTEFPADHDCQKYIETAVGIFDASDTVGEALNAAVGATKEKYPDVWRDSASMEWIAAAFISFGTEEVLIRNKDRFYLAAAITFSEFLKQHLECEFYKSQPLLYMARVHELLLANNERRLVSYLKKRIPCGCLDGAYEKVKSWSKMGRCNCAQCTLPNRRVGLSAMKSCEGCRRAHYCSEACQAADWDKHKDDCKIWRKWQASG